MTGGLIIAAPSSGSGKTTVTLGLLRAFMQAGRRVRGAKSGPDYIDPRFHEAACGQACVNLDAWAMPPARIAQLATGNGTLIIEGAMGLFDGAPPNGKGAVADLARQLKMPTILVVDGARMAQSIAPLVAGFAHHDSQVRIKGVIVNKVGSARHEAMLRQALAPLDIPVLGAVPRDSAIVQPSRHLGLVQAQERPDLEAFLDHAADVMRAHLDLEAIWNLQGGQVSTKSFEALDLRRKSAPPAQTIAIAQDAAFAFAYPHQLKDWHAQGAQIRFFSPLANEPVPTCDLVFLPGGYPELFAHTLSAAGVFWASLRAHAGQKPVYGECGGYMTLGDGLVDANGTCHQMAGLLRLETSFAKRKLHLGYRSLNASHGPFQGQWRGHEFHYARTLKAEGTPLFTAADAAGTMLADMGLRLGHVCGSFAHIIDAA